MNQKILLVEDDESLTDGLVYSLEKNGFSVDSAASVKEARIFLSTVAYDLLLLDVTLPDGNGFELCEQVRSQGNLVPVIFLTALDEEVHVIRGLEGGGDDYITKPFRLGELCSRIRALLRRSQNLAESSSRLSSGPVTVDLLSNRAFLDHRPLLLTNAEYRLLCLFLQNAGIILSLGGKITPRNRPHRIRFFSPFSIHQVLFFPVFGRLFRFFRTRGLSSDVLRHPVFPEKGSALSNGR